MQSQGLASPSQRKRRVADRDRQRATKACDSCRRLKEKCDGGAPCRRCIRVRRKCEFTSLTSTRHSNTEDASARSQDESFQGEEAAELTQRLHYMERLLAHYVGDVSMDTASLRGLVDAVDRNRATQPDGVTDASQDSDDLGPNPEITVQPLENNMTHYSGEFSHWNFAMRIKQWIDQNASYQHGDGTIDHNDYFRAVELQSPAGTVASLTSLPPRFVAEFLTQAFFKHAESNYFYIEKLWFMSKLELAYSDPDSITRRDVPTVCIIFMVLAIGTQYAYLDSPPADGSQRGNETTPFSEDAIGIMLYRKACELVPDVITISSLESVQACLLVGVYTLPLDTSGLSYIYLNLAVKLAIQNGMHRKYTGGGLDPVVRETRNRVWWTAYTAERRVGIFHGRPISVASSDVDAEMPCECNHPGLSTASTHLAAMKVTLQLHQTLATISQEISSLKNYTRSHLTSTLGRLVSLTNGLCKWWGNLPYAFDRAPLDRSPEVSRPEMHINLEYCLVRIFAGRPFISLRAAKRKTPKSPNSPTDSTQKMASPKLSESDPKSVLVSDCVAAALSVVDILKLLRNSIGLARASYTEFSSCRAALLVIISQCLLEKSAKLRQALRDGLVMINFMSAGSESSRSDASLIEAFERVIAQLDAADSSSHQPNESNYTRFKQWETLWKKDSTQNHGSLDLSPSPNVIAIQDASLTAAPPADFPAMDWNFASFPQTMDEFSSMFSFGGMPESTGSTNMSPGDGNGPSSWMGHQSWS